MGVFRTHLDAPRVLIANANLVPHWATQTYFDELDRKGLIMYGQMTAGSWIYIGTQGILQGTYETLAVLRPAQLRRLAAGAAWSSLPAWAAWAGAQPLAVTMNEGVALVVEVDEARIRRRLETRYLDTLDGQPGPGYRVGAGRPVARERRSPLACWATPPRSFRPC